MKHTPHFAIPIIVKELAPEDIAEERSKALPCPLQAIKSANKSNEISRLNQAHVPTKDLSNSTCCPLS